MLCLRLNGFVYILDLDGPSRRISLRDGKRERERKTGSPWANFRQLKLRSSFYYFPMRLSFLDGAHCDTPRTFPLVRLCRLDRRQIDYAGTLLSEPDRTRRTVCRSLCEYTRRPEDFQLYIGRIGSMAFGRARCPNDARRLAWSREYERVARRHNSPCANCDTVTSVRESEVYVTKGEDSAASHMTYVRVHQRAGKQPVRDFTNRIYRARRQTFTTRG